MRTYLLALLLLPGTLPAQTPSSYDLFVNGGISQPLYPRYLDENWRWGFNAGVGLGYYVLPALALTGTADFYSFRFDDLDFYGRLGQTGYITTVEGQMSWVGALAAEARYFLNVSSDDTFVFLTGGVGVQRIRMGEIRTLHQSPEEGLIKEDFYPARTNVGVQLHFGTGLDLVASEDRSYYVEVRYVVGFLGNYNSHFLPVKIGIRQRL